MDVGWKTSSLENIFPNTSRFEYPSLNIQSLRDKVFAHLSQFLNKTKKEIGALLNSDMFKRTHAQG